MNPLAPLEPLCSGFPKRSAIAQEYAWVTSGIDKSKVTQPTTEPTEMMAKIRISDFPESRWLRRIRNRRTAKVLTAILSGPGTDQGSRNRGKPENGNSEGASQRVALSGLRLSSKGRCQIWHPGRTRYAAPLLSIPESPERFHLQTTTSDASDAISQFHPAHDRAKTHMEGSLPFLHYALSH